VHGDTTVDHCDSKVDYSVTTVEHVAAQ